MRKILFSEKAIPLPNITQMFQNTRAFIGAYFCAREYLGILEALVYINKFIIIYIISIY